MWRLSSSILGQIQERIETYLQKDRRLRIGYSECWLKGQKRQRGTRDRGKGASVEGRIARSIRGLTGQLKLLYSIVKTKRAHFCR